MRFFGVITAAAIKKAHAEGANKKKQTSEENESCKDELRRRTDSSTTVKVTVCVPELRNDSLPMNTRFPFCFQVIGDMLVRDSS